MIYIARENMDARKTREVDKPKCNVLSVEQPEEIIRPVVDEEIVQEIVQEMYGLTVTDMKELNSYSARNYFIQVAPHGRQSRPVTQQLQSDGYVVKIYNSRDSANLASFDAHHEMMSCLIQKNIPTKKPVQNLNGDLYSLHVIYADAERKGTPGKYLVELRPYIPGRIIKEVPYTTNLLFQDGCVIANMTEALKDFDNSYLKTRGQTSRLWSPTNVPMMSKYTICLRNEERHLIEDIVSTYTTRVVSKFQHLPRGYIHGDINDQNILVSQNASGDDYNICGIIDFVEAEYSFPVIDLAVNIAYMMLNSDVTDQLDSPGYILAGYLSVRTLTQVEWDVLIPCVTGRLAQSLTVAAYAHNLQSDNKYVVATVKKGWPLLKRLWSEYESDLLSKWKSVVDNFHELQE